MAQATQPYNRFHNLSNEALADAIGQADAVLKGAEAECKALKDDFKQRGLLRSPANTSPSLARPSLQPARRCCCEAIPRRRVSQVRDREHHHSDPHQGQPAPRARGLTLADIAFSACGGNAASIFPDSKMRNEIIKFQRSHKRPTTTTTKTNLGSGAERCEQGGVRCYRGAGDMPA